MYPASSRVRQTPEEGRRTYRPKHCGNNKYEDNSLKTLNDKNQQASSQKFRQLLGSLFVTFCRNEKLRWEMMSETSLQ